MIIMVISATLIQKPRQQRICEHCGKTMAGPQVKVYGRVFYGDFPYTVYICPEDAAKDPDVKAKLEQQEDRKKRHETGNA